MAGVRMIPTRALAHGASALGLPARERGESQYFAGDRRGLKAMFASRPPPPLLLPEVWALLWPPLL